MVKDVATLPAEISLAEAGHDHFLRSGYGAYPWCAGTPWWACCAAATS